MKVPVNQEILADRNATMRMVRAAANPAEMPTPDDMAVVQVDQVGRQAVHDLQLHIIMGMMIAEVSNSIHMTKSFISQFHNTHNTDHPTQPIDDDFSSFSLCFRFCYAIWNFIFHTIHWNFEFHCPTKTVFHFPQFDSVHLMER